MAYVVISFSILLWYVYSVIIQMRGRFIIFFLFQDKGWTCWLETDRRQSPSKYHIAWVSPHRGLAPKAAGEEESRGSVHSFTSKGRLVLTFLQHVVDYEQFKTFVNTPSLKNESLKRKWWCTNKTTPKWLCELVYFQIVISKSQGAMIDPRYWYIFSFV